MKSLYFLPEASEAFPVLEHLQGPVLRAALRIPNLVNLSLSAFVNGLQDLPTAAVEIPLTAHVVSPVDWRSDCTLFGPYCMTLKGPEDSLGKGKGSGLMSAADKDPPSGVPGSTPPAASRSGSSLIGQCHAEPGTDNLEYFGLIVFRSRIPSELTGGHVASTDNLLPPLLQIRCQGHQTDLQGLGQHRDHVQGWIPEPSLKQADVIPCHACTMRQLLLRDPKSLAALADHATKPAAQVNPGQLDRAG